MTSLAKSPLLTRCIAIKLTHTISFFFKNAIFVVRQTLFFAIRFNFLHRPMFLVMNHINLDFLKFACICSFGGNCIHFIKYIHTQWRSHWGVKEGRQSATPDSEKFAKIRKNEEKNQEKSGEIGKKRQKLGRFFHFAPPDR